MTSPELDAHRVAPVAVMGPYDRSPGRGYRTAALSSKVCPRHLDRDALVYVRQSSARQVAENRESTQLQYRLRERAVDLGWSETGVVVIDDDLGQSGQSVSGRPGFQRLLAEVGLDHVGLVLGIEMSRLARSCRDWHQLLELCAVFGTLLADADGVYDPRDYNDRLLLGLKGTMSEAELHLLRGRLEGGQRNKARRGEFFNHAPIGYVRAPEGGLGLEPDEQARAVVALIFAKFAELGSVAAVLRYLTRQQIQMGVRDHRGPEAGQLKWRPPNRATLQGMFHHPIYAGAYTYGRRHTNPRKRVAGRPGSGRAWGKPEDWLVLLRDLLPSYISWEQYEANRRRLRDNSSKFGRGAPRGGSSLLGGLLACGRCGRRMAIEYVARAKLRLTCNGARNHFGGPQCQALMAEPVEQLVSRQVLAALEPASLELSLAAADQIESERRRLRVHHEQSLERAQYAADRARRHYMAVEPEHRLVARALEQRWEEALLEERAARESLERFEREQPSLLTDAQRAEIRSLASSVPALWNAPTTPPSDRQAIVRQLVEKVVVTVVDGTERVEVMIHWVGGYESQHEVRRPVSSYGRLQDGYRALARVRELKQQGLTHGEIARRLTGEGFLGPRGQEFTVPMVSFMWRRAHAPKRPTTPDVGSHSPEANGECSRWRGGVLSNRLDIPAATLNTWRRRGWIHAQQRCGRWIYWANEAELNRLTTLRRYPRAAMKALPTELTTPTSAPPWTHE